VSTGTFSTLTRRRFELKSDARSCRHVARLLSGGFALCISLLLATCAPHVADPPRPTSTQGAQSSGAGCPSDTSHEVPKTAATEPTSNATVTIEFECSRVPLPEEWDAKASPLSSRVDRERLTGVVLRAFGKYPKQLFFKRVRQVVLLRALTIQDQSVTGTAIDGALIVVSECNGKQLDDLTIERAFHYQVANMFFQTNPELLDSNAWLQANPPRFEYGIEQIHTNYEPLYGAKNLVDGFLTSESKSRLREDFCTYAQELLCGSGSLWAASRDIGNVRLKLDLVVAFYEKLDKAFTRDQLKSFQH